MSISVANANAHCGGAEAASVPPRRARDAFHDCALVEIIHLHDCFRGALRNLEVDVSELCCEITAADAAAGGPRHGEDNNNGNIKQNNNNIKNKSINANLGNNVERITDLERRVAGRFTVIWSVFRAHSAAEDEFIWPALKAKQVDLPPGVACDDCASDPPIRPVPSSGRPDQGGGDGGEPLQLQRERAQSMTVHTIEQEEYEEDHADEERMFNSINGMLSSLRDELSNRRGRVPSTSAAASADGGLSNLRQLAQNLLEGTGNLMRHLMDHLDKEETHCMPLVAQYLTKAEINDLVGKIMGKRSSELMAQILTMAVQTLDEADRDDMVRYMKQAMVGTFFERWLKMGGWDTESGRKKAGGDPAGDDDGDDDGGGKLPPGEQGRDGRADASVAATSGMEEDENDTGMAAPMKGPAPPSTQQCAASDAAAASSSAVAASAAATPTAAPPPVAVAATKSRTDEDASTGEKRPSATELAIEASMKGKYTSAAELEKLIRAIMTNPHLDGKQKNLTVQGLRNSVWKSNNRLKRKREEEIMAASAEQQMMPPAQVARAAVPSPGAAGAVGVGAAAAASAQQLVPSGIGYPYQGQQMCIPIPSATRPKRETPPSSYYKKAEDGEVKLVWSSDPLSPRPHPPTDGSVPLFSASELAPTYHDGVINQVLGCPHYARSCKLRHPKSGRLYTCRLCCEQDREMATKDKDSPLDRYEVSEILCMQCGALQPAGEACVNPNCPTAGKPFARYSCKICNFHDDSPNKSIYHCPFCNVCRTGKGLGIDYRHCMRCNACVSMKDEHHCIPQRLQGNCPICHETMFQSTEPLRGLRCGHVMHLSCFSQYMRGHSYTCPLCKKSAEDMKEYFALLDSAVRMQPMPPAYAGTTSNIYCQDCCKMGNVSYHFVGLKCQHCGSYNTRELQRVDANMMASIWQGP